MPNITSVLVRIRSPLWKVFLRGRAAIAAALIVLIAVPTACAQAAEGAPAEGGKSWAIPWLIVVLGVALGLFITLRPAGRAAEIKRDLRADL
jgi:hypothetical protein